ncbi:hypothetical protein [Endozoicomonas sp. 4G]|uniref:hypothetical protein n=1 Tax=Endozoicomonas sp. 4G TaxID=2872754 RepID=UPI002078FF68|nr:hypothetical protein [Endozoicomonas sp. 4G]
MSAIDEAKSYLGQLAPRISAKDRRVARVIRGLLADREATCTWTDDPEGIWHTDCGEAFEVHAGSPGQNGLRYCCFCGRKLAEGST